MRKIVKKLIFERGKYQICIILKVGKETDELKNKAQIMEIICGEILELMIEPYILSEN